MKIFVLHATYSDYDYSCTQVLGVFREGEFLRCVELVKSHLGEEAKKYFNSKSFNFEVFNKDFTKVTSALNCKENNAWDGLNLFSYTKNNDARSAFNNEDHFVVECHWLGKEQSQ
ncbi:MAG: hypothetical protein RR231_12125 [Acinetobacter sp.]